MFEVININDICVMFLYYRSFFSNMCVDLRAESLGTPPSRTRGSVIRDRLSVTEV